MADGSRGGETFYYVAFYSCFSFEPCECTISSNTINLKILKFGCCKQINKAQLNFPCLPLIPSSLRISQMMKSRLASFMLLS